MSFQILAVAPPQVLDVVSAVSPEYWELKEVSLFLTQPNTLDSNAALGLYIKAWSSEWLYRGCVHNSHPSEVMPLQVCHVLHCCPPALFG